LPLPLMPLRMIDTSIVRLSTTAPRSSRSTAPAAAGAVFAFLHRTRLPATYRNGALGEHRSLHRQLPNGYKVVVAAWEGDIDRAKARRILDGEIVPSSETLDPAGASAPVAGLQTS